MLIMLNGVFAMSEMSVVSSKKVRLQHWADEGRPGASMALRLANEPSNFLSTIQVGITVIGITSGAFGEATLARGLSEWLSQWPLLDEYSDGLAIALVVFGITVVTVILGELVPKRLALLNPEAIASVIAKPMGWLSWITHPVVRALSVTTEGMLNVVGLRTSNNPPVTEEEIKVLMEQGTEAGVFEEHEQVLVSRVFRLDQLRVTGIMTAATDVCFLDLDEPLEINVRRIQEESHSRFPVVRGGLDRMEGFVLARSLLADALSEKPVDLAAHVIKPLYVPATVTAMGLVELFRKHRQTMAIVVNEYGAVQGLVTLNDVMEALVGDIATVDEEGDRDMVKRADGSWFIDGAVTLERLKGELGIAENPIGEEAGAFHTVGGFVMHQLGRIPAVSESFVCWGWRWEVVDMDGRRVDKVLVAPLPKASPIEQGESN